MVEALTRSGSGKNAKTKSSSCDDPSSGTDDQWELIAEAAVGGLQSQRGIQERARGPPGVRLRSSKMALLLKILARGQTALCHHRLFLCSTLEAVVLKKWGLLVI